MVRLSVAAVDEVLAAGDAMARERPVGTRGLVRWVMFSDPTESTMRRFVTAAIATTRPAG